MANTYPIVRLNINNQTIEFRNHDVIDARVIQEVHPIGIEVPASMATIRIYTTDPRFSPFSDGEFYAELVNNLIVDVYESLDDVEHYIGRFYLDEWKNPIENEFEFVCRDAIGVLDTISFDGMFWENSVSLGEAISTILDPVGIPYSVSDVVAGRMVKGYLPASKLREALQQVLFAGRAIAVTAQSDQIVIKDVVLPVPGVNETTQYYGDPYFGQVFFGDYQYDGVIGTNDKTDKQDLKLEPLVTGIELISHDYTKGLTQEEIYSAWLEPGDYKIVYSKPYYDVVAEGVGSVPAYLMTEDNRAITTEDSCVLSWEGAYQYGVNHIFLHVVIAGNVVVRGYPWIASTRAFVYDEAEATKKYSSGAVYGDTATYGEVYYAKFWQVSAAPNVWKVEKATMVSADIAPDVFNMLIHFAKLRYRQNMTLFPRASIRPGHFKLVESLYQKGVNGIVTKITSKLTGGFLLDTELLGIERKF